MDEADFADENISRELELRIAAAARPIEPGVSGECVHCGEPSKRLIRMACARCRDKFKLP